MKKFILIVTLIVIVYVSIFVLIEYNNSKNTLIELDGVDTYFNEFEEATEEDTDYLDDLIYSIYKLGYRDEFIELYNVKINMCFPQLEGYPYGCFTDFSENEQGIKDDYFLLLKNLEGDVVNVNYNSEYLSSHLFEVNNEYVITGSTTIFHDKTLLEQVSKLQNNINYNEVYKNGFCEGYDRIWIYYAHNIEDISKGIVTISGDGMTSCGYDAIDYKIYAFDYFINSLYDYEYGNQDEKRNAENFLSRYYYVELENGETFDEIYESLNLDYVFLEEYINEEFKNNEVLDTEAMVGKYDKYKQLYKDVIYYINN